MREKEHHNNQSTTLSSLFLSKKITVLGHGYETQMTKFATAIRITSLMNSVQGKEA